MSIPREIWALLCHRRWPQRQSAYVCFLPRTAFSPKTNTNSAGPTHIILQALHNRVRSGVVNTPNMSQLQMQLVPIFALAKESHLHNAGDQDTFGPGVDLVDLEVLRGRAIGAIPEGRNINYSQEWFTSAAGVHCPW